MLQENPQELLPGIYKITVPPPCKWMPPTSSYLLFSGKEAVLIDPGYPDPKVMGMLEELVPQGLRFSVILTHGHIDHCAASGILMESRGARVMVHEMDVEKVSLGAVRALKMRKKEVEAHWRALGFERIGELWEALRRLEDLYPEPLKDISPLPREVTVGNKSLMVIHTPGHTAGSVCLLLKGESIMFSGDTLLPSGYDTWLAGLCFAEKGAYPEDYIGSLHKIAVLDPRLILPGHGEPFTDLRGRLSEGMARRKERKDRVLEALTEERTAYQISLLLDPEPEGFVRLISVSMVLEALRELEKEGLVESRGGEVLFWRRSWGRRT